MISKKESAKQMRRNVKAMKNTLELQNLSENLLLL